MLGAGSTGSDPGHCRDRRGLGGDAGGGSRAADPHADANALSTASLADQYASSDPYLDFNADHSNCDADADPDVSSDCHADSGSYPDCGSYADTHTDSYTSPYAYT